MRWKVRPVPKLGDRRILRRFLFLPKTVNGETRWMEVGEWEEEYIPVENYLNFNRWDAVRWTDQPDVPSRWVTLPSKPKSDIPPPPPRPTGQMVTGSGNIVQPKSDI